MKKLPERSRERGVPEDEQVKQHALAHGKERQHQPDTTIVHDHMMLIIIDYASNESTCTAESNQGSRLPVYAPLLHSFALLLRQCLVAGICRPYVADQIPATSEIEWQKGFA